MSPLKALINIPPVELCPAGNNKLGLIVTYFTLVTFISIWDELVFMLTGYFES